MLSLTSWLIGLGVTLGLCIVIIVMFSDFIFGELIDEMESFGVLCVVVIVVSALWPITIVLTLVGGFGYYLKVKYKTRVVAWFVKTFDIEVEDDES